MVFSTLSNSYLEKPEFASVPKHLAVESRHTYLVVVVSHHVHLVDGPNVVQVRMLVRYESSLTYKTVADAIKKMEVLTEYESGMLQEHNWMPLAVFIEGFGVRHEDLHLWTTQSNAEHPQLKVCAPIRYDEFDLDHVKDSPVPWVRDLYNEVLEFYKDMNEVKRRLPVQNPQDKQNSDDDTPVVSLVQSMVLTIQTQSRQDSSKVRQWSTLLVKSLRDMAYKAISDEFSFDQIPEVRGDTPQLALGNEATYGGAHARDEVTYISNARSEAMVQYGPVPVPNLPSDQDLQHLMSSLPGFDPQNQAGPSSSHQPAVPFIQQTVEYSQQAVYQPNIPAHGGYYPAPAQGIYQPSPPSQGVYPPFNTRSESAHGFAVQGYDGSTMTGFGNYGSYDR